MGEVDADCFVAVENDLVYECFAEDFEFGPSGSVVFVVTSCRVAALTLVWASAGNRAERVVESDMVSAPWVQRLLVVS